MMQHAPRAGPSRAILRKRAARAMEKLGRPDLAAAAGDALVGVMRAFWPRTVTPRTAIAIAAYIVLRIRAKKRVTLAQACDAAGTAYSSTASAWPGGLVRHWEEVACKGRILP